MTEWGELRPLIEPVQGLATFPDRYLPEWLQQYGSALSETLQVPRDMVYTCALGVLSCAAHGQWFVDCSGMWHEQVCLFLAVCADPGERKSGCLSALLRPVIQYQNEYNNSSQEAMAASAAKQVILKQRFDRLQKEFTAGKKETTLDDVIAARIELDAYEPLHPLQFFTDDVTEEKLAILMKQQKENMSVISAEGGVLDNMSGKYGRANAFDLYLKGFSGDYVQIDRVMRESVMLKHPRLTVCLMIQPILLQKLSTDDAFKGKGLSARFLYAAPPPMVGSRAVSAPSMDLNLAAHWDSCITDLCAVMLDTPARLTLDSDARSLLDDFRASYEPQLGAKGAFSHLSAWGSKLPGAVVRIAGLLHLTEHHAEGEDAAQTGISADTMQAAIEIGGYFHRIANVLFNKSNTSADVSLASDLWNRILMAHRGETMRLSSLTYLARNIQSTALERTAALDVLEERGYIQRISDISESGKPFTLIVVRP